jgi:thymidine kinase
MIKKIALIVLCVVSLTSFGMARLGSPMMRTSSTSIPEEHTGGLTLITGPMSCGKSDEIMRIISVLQHSRCKILVCKHSFDTRSSQFLTSRRKTENPIAAQLVSDPHEIINMVVQNPVDYVAIDEVQFFKHNPMTDVIQSLIHRGVYVIASGLDKDFKGEPFGLSAAEPLCIASLLAIADEVIKLKAVCEVCKQWNATMTQRLINGQPARRSDPLIVVDDGTKREVIYEPRCRGCYRLDE